MKPMTSASDADARTPRPIAAKRFEVRCRRVRAAA